MSEHQASCKICRKPIFVQVDDDYTEDIYKLLPMATCNRCYDMRWRRDKLHKAISRVCIPLHIMAGKIKEADLARYRSALTVLTKKYVEWMCDFHDATHPEYLWDEGFVNLLMEHPADWMKHLANVRTSVRNIIERSRQSRESVAAQ